MKPRTKSNSTALIKTLLTRGLTVQQAAREANISGDTFAALLKADRHISIKTAAKLRATFGTDTVTITEPTQI